MPGIHRNPNWKEFLKSCESFLRKSQFSTVWSISWILQTLGHVKNIFCKCHLHNASKEVFQPKFFLNSMHEFKSAILTIFQFWQNGTFELMLGIQNFFWPKDFFWSVMKMTFTKNIPNMSQDPPNPGFRYLNLENWDFLKKDSQDFKNSFQFGFLWIPSKTGEQN